MGVFPVQTLRRAHSCYGCSAQQPSASYDRVLAEHDPVLAGRDAVLAEYVSSSSNASTSERMYSVRIGGKGSLCLCLW